MNTNIVPNADDSATISAPVSDTERIAQLEAALAQVIDLGTGAIAAVGLEVAKAVAPKSQKALKAAAEAAATNAAVFRVKSRAVASGLDPEMVAAQPTPAPAAYTETRTRLGLVVNDSPQLYVPGNAGQLTKLPRRLS